MIYMCKVDYWDRLADLLSRPFPKQLILHCSYGLPSGLPPRTLEAQAGRRVPVRPCSGRVKLGP
jgi:hypothetical protein